MKAVIFDMDGLLIDSEHVTYMTYQAICQRLGYDINDDFYLPLIGTNIKNIRQRFKENYGEGFPFDDVLTEVKAAIQETFDVNPPLKEGAIELLAYLKENKIKRALATSSGRDHAEKILKKSHLKEYFDISVCGDEISHSKPDPEIFLKACDHLDVQPEEALVLEDSLNGIRAAYQGRIPCIHVPDMIMANEEIKKKALYIAKDLKEVKMLIESGKI